ncbi:uncharacterized protein PAC_00088 [Phialocephala subalpina]|uniref:Amidase domain-containing protein n=1 Tax=Phialocephala subalpina TaxID=576137 RepID=A0A1L7WBR0_9HELO|nr:uncharacterized protein PAC_00088 [Phialocephala subalpina]
MTEAALGIDAIRGIFSKCALEGEAERRHCHHYSRGDKILDHSNPCGSPSGSAAGVAAGFAPLTLGTETDGSISQPAGRASLYAIKATVGGIITEGTSPTALSATAPIATTFVPELVEKQESDIVAASDRIEQSGAKVVRDVKLILYQALEINGRDALEEVWDHDFQQNIARFLEGCIDPPSDLWKYSLNTISRITRMKFHNDQGQLEDAIGNHISDEGYEKAKIFIRTAARGNGFDSIFANFDVDLVVSLLDWRVGWMSAAAGYPHANVLLGYSDDFNGRAYGLTIVAGAGHENKIVQFMSTWEASHPKHEKATASARQLGFWKGVYVAMIAMTAARMFKN